MAEELSAIDAERRARSGKLLLVDLRTPAERLVDGAVALAQVPDSPERLREMVVHSALPVALLCRRGVRSRRLCTELQPAARVRLYSVAGGVEAWREAGLGLDPVESVFSPRERERYRRHFVLPQVGPSGQLRLKNARVLLVGAGGLGSPAALYLAAAGIGRIVIVDDDRVERSNLQRQVLHAEPDLGRLKVDSARERLQRLNPDVRIETGAERLGPHSVDAWLADADLVIDGSDNFPTRYLLNRACLRQRKPLIYGAVERFSGQVGVFFAGRPNQPCYRCLFPEPPSAEDAPNCAEAGVLGVLPGIIGALQANEALKLLLNIGDSLVGQVLFVDALGMNFRKVRVPPDPDCADCGGFAAGS